MNYAGRREAAGAVVQSIEAAGGQAFAVQGDVSKPQDVRALFDAAIERFGRVHILVNNAGIILYKRVDQTTDEEFDRLFAVNAKGTFNALREASRRLEDGGRIINFSSTTTRLMLPTYASYCATKAAVEQMTRIFAREIGHRGITVNVVSPGPTNTKLFTEGKSEADIQKMAAMAALGRIGEPDDIANLVIFLASDEAGWISAQNIGSNGGLA
ncbi:MAG: SDR family oxidoreductase [Pirellulales bacterium]